MEMQYIEQACLLLLHPRHWASKISPAILLGADLSRPYWLCYRTVSQTMSVSHLLLQPVEDTQSTTMTNILGATRTLSHLCVLLYTYRIGTTKVNSLVYFVPPCI